MAAFNQFTPPWVSFDGLTASQSRARFNAAIVAAVADDGWVFIRPYSVITLDASLDAVTSGNLRIAGNGSIVVYSGADVVDGGVGATNSLYGIIKYENASGVFVCEGIEILRTSAPTAIGLLHGIAVSKSLSAIIRDCSVHRMHNCGMAIRRSPYVEIDSSRVNENGYAGHTTCGGEVKITNNRYALNGISGTGAGYNMAFASAQFGDEAPPLPSLISGNKHYGVVRKAIDIHHGNGVLVTGNHISGSVSETVSQPSMIYALAEGADKDVRGITIVGNTVDVDDSATIGSIGIYSGGPAATTGLSGSLGSFVTLGNSVKGVLAYGIFSGGTHDAVSGQIELINISDNTIQLGESSGAIGIGAGRGTGSQNNVRMLRVANNSVAFGSTGNVGYVLNGGVTVAQVRGNVSTSTGASPWGLRTSVDTRLVLRDNDIYGPYQQDVAASTLNKGGNYFSGTAD